MADILMPAGDGTHRVIEAEAIRALMGWIDYQSEPDPAPASQDPTDTGKET